MSRALGKPLMVSNIVVTDVPPPTVTYCFRGVLYVLKQAHRHIVNTFQIYIWLHMDKG